MPFEAFEVIFSASRLLADALESEGRFTICAGSALRAAYRSAGQPWSAITKSGGQLADTFRPFPVAPLRFVTNRGFLATRPQSLYLSHFGEICEWWLGRESTCRQASE
jgi:hypothetical protein